MGRTVLYRVEATFSNRFADGKAVFGNFWKSLQFTAAGGSKIVRLSSLPITMINGIVQTTNQVKSTDSSDSNG